MYPGRTPNESTKSYRSRSTMFYGHSNRSPFSSTTSAFSTTRIVFCHSGQDGRVKRKNAYTDECMVFLTRTVIALLRLCVESGLFDDDGKTRFSQTRIKKQRKIRFTRAQFRWGFTDGNDLRAASRILRAPSTPLRCYTLVLI